MTERKQAATSPDEFAKKEAEKRKARYEFLYYAKDEGGNRLKRCALCHWSGFVTARNDKEGNTYAFRCDACEAASMQSLSPDIPIWRGQEGFTPLIG